jgi:hypothetical protein
MRFRRLLLANGAHKMKRTLNFGSPFASVLLALASGLNATTALSQTPCVPTPTKTVACQCNQWTCPACQQRSNCTPACPPTPTTNDSVGTPSGSESGQGALQTPPSATPAPGQSASESAAALAAEMDSSQFNPQSRGSSNQLASRGSSNYSDTPEFQGDNFGTGAGESVVAQIFSYPQLLGDEIFPGQFAFDVAGNPDQGPNDITTNGVADANGVYNVDVANDPTDAAKPSGSEFIYAGGTATPSTPGTSNPYDIRYAYTSGVRLPSSVTGRMKLAENVSPIPRNRLFFNYSSFNNVPLTPRGITVNRFTPGFEKTFFGKLASVELRTPFATTLDSNIFTDGSTNTSKAEFGNLFLAFKGILLATDTWAISGGTSLTLPTADDNRVFTRDGVELVRVVNQSVHIMPFIGGVYAPSSRFFTQGILQVDIDANGNDVLAQNVENGQNTLRSIGRFNDSTFMYADLGMGYWLLKRGRRDNSFLQGIIPTVEAHWNRSLNDADHVTDTTSIGDTSVPTTVIQPVISQLDVLNMVGGCAFQFRNNSRIAIGYAAPVGNSKDRVFDGEWRATWNKFY